VTTFVVPKFTGVFASRGKQMPGPTRVLLALNDLIRNQWGWVILGIIALILLFRWYTSKPYGRYQYDFLKLKVPVIGKLLFFLYMSRFSKILSELLKTGVPILQSLQLVSDTLNNKVIERGVMAIQKSVNEGKGMSSAMKNTGLFTPMVVQMVEVGEHSGRTDELLAYVAEYYEDQANMMIKNFSTLIEPILLFVIGGMVLLLALGVFMPVWDLVNVMR
jgi:MSHA biogenesis protein MshG